MLEERKTIVRVEKPLQPVDENGAGTVGVALRSGEWPLRLKAQTCHLLHLGFGPGSHWLSSDYGNICRCLCLEKAQRSIYQTYHQTFSPPPSVALWLCPQPVIFSPLVQTYHRGDAFVLLLLICLSPNTWEDKLSRRYSIKPNTSGRCEYSREQDSAES